jgi:hypothetical protein
LSAVDVAFSAPAGYPKRTRPSMVKLGRQLLADHEYPSRRVIREIAKLLSSIVAAERN